jgi:hypothetical protein
VACGRLVQPPHNSMTTPRDLIQSAFEAVRVYAPGEAALDADMARGFTRLNRMLDSWSNESLTTFALLEQSAPLVVGQSAYTIGPGGDFNMVRPIRIIDGPGSAYLLDTNGNRYPVDVIPQAKWNTIWNISRSTSNLPDTIFYDPQFPLGIINVYPLYSGGVSVTLFWDSYLSLVKLTSLDVAVMLPPGYEKAIEDNLAIELEPYFPTAIVSPLLRELASTSKANIKRSNIRENVAVFEKELRARGGAVYNVYSDTAR